MSPTLRKNERCSQFRKSQPTHPKSSQHPPHVLSTHCHSAFSALCCPVPVHCQSARPPHVSPRSPASTRLSRSACLVSSNIQAPAIAYDLPSITRSIPKPSSVHPHVSDFPSVHPNASKYSASKSRLPSSPYPENVPKSATMDTMSVSWPSVGTCAPMCALRSLLHPSVPTSGVSFVSRARTIPCTVRGPATRL